MDWCEKGEDTGIVTKQGDKVVAINTEKSLMIVRLEREGLLGTEYNGYLAVVKDPSRVELGLCRGMGKREGQRIADLADYNEAILGINASGFIDNGEVAEGSLSGNMLDLQDGIRKSLTSGRDFYDRA